LGGSLVTDGFCNFSKCLCTFTHWLIHPVEGSKAPIFDIPSLPYYSSLGLAYSIETPKLAEIQQHALAKLDEVVKQFNLPADKVHTHAISGSPKDQILKLADSIRADLIIIASHRPDISTYLLGSNAAVVVRHATCPVLVVR
jgi:universal stress protein F